MNATFGLGKAPAANNSSEDIDSSTPWVAVADGNLPLLQSSLKALSLQPSAADENGYTLLQAAASYSHLDIVRWLLSQRVNVNAVDGEGDSALHYASTVDAARLLIQANIDASLVNSSGLTALETKREELQEMMEDDGYDEEDSDAIHLRSIIDYLTQLPSH